MSFSTIPRSAGFEGTGYFLNMERGCGAYETAREFYRTHGGLSWDMLSQALLHRTISDNTYRWLHFILRWGHFNILNQCQWDFLKSYGTNRADAEEALAYRIEKARRIFRIESLK